MSENQTSSSPIINTPEPEFTQLMQTPLFNDMTADSKAEWGKLIEAQRESRESNQGLKL